MFKQFLQTKATWRLKAILLAFRPKTLTATIAPCLGAASLVKALGYAISPQIFWNSLLSAGFIQIATNLFNDALDFKKGADREDRIGPQRITQSGILPAKYVMMLGFGFLFLALIFGIPLVVKGGVQVLGVGIISLFLAYGYTGGPWPLAYLGLGEIFVVLFFGVISVCTLVYLYTEKWIFDSLFLGLQIGLHASVLIAINNARDREGDIRANKKTLAVRWGEKFSQIEIGVLCVMPFLLNWYWQIRFGLWPVLLPMLILYKAIRLSKKIYQTSPSRVYNEYLGESAFLHLAFAFLISLGLFLC